MTKKIALITGATAGIGLESARILAKNSFNLILTGRRAERLETIKKELEETGAQVLCLNFDVRVKSEVDAALESRITSYNVCYTKLLRALHDKN